MKPRFSGVHTIMPTPFTADGSVDLDSLAALTKFLVGLGVNGLVVLGVMGEAPKLSQKEQEDVIRVTVTTAAGQAPVFVGTGAEGTDLAIQKSLKAQELGATGFLIAPPPIQNDQVIFEYYRRINGEVTGSIILHDYPAVTRIRLGAELVARLFEELENVEVIKLEDPPTNTKTSAIRRLGSDISIVGGLGGLYFYEELERGADGMMTGFSYPDILLSIYKAYTQGEKDKARRIFYQACALMRYEFQPGIGLALRKEIYRQRGAIESAFVRHPGAQIDDHLRRELSSVLEHSDLERLMMA